MVATRTTRVLPCLFMELPAVAAAGQPVAVRQGRCARREPAGVAGHTTSWPAVSRILAVPSRWSSVTAVLAQVV